MRGVLAVAQWIVRMPPKREIQVRFLSAGPDQTPEEFKDFRFFFVCRWKPLSCRPEECAEAWHVPGHCGGTFGGMFSGNRGTSKYAPCPMPHAPCPMPHAHCLCLHPADIKAPKAMPYNPVFNPLLNALKRVRYFHPVSA
jgi:hypothetical protein